MIQLQFILKEISLRSRINKLPQNTACILFIILVLFPACASQKMSLEEAKRVTVTMGDESFVPPPRRINDVLSVLDQPIQFDQAVVRKFEALADKSPPQGADNVELAYFFRRRGFAALQLGRLNQVIRCTIIRRDRKICTACRPKTGRWECAWNATTRKMPLLIAGWHATVRRMLLVIR